MKDPIIFRRQDTLSPADARYWKDLLYRVVKVGTELEVAPPKGMKRKLFEDAVHDALAPSGSLDLLGENGVWDVQKEHCGVEIRIIGRHPHFRALHQQYTQIMSALQGHGSRARPTCGLHFHLLTPGLAEPVPEIILANLWNLTRRYAPELRYITSGGEKREALCRRRNYTSHLEMVRHSPGNLSMQEIKGLLDASLIVPKHQNFLNLEHLEFTEDGAALPFHLEFRFPDADISATSVTAKTFLFMALLLKAVDLSQYGVIHVGKIQPWRRKIELMHMLSNNDGNVATSDTTAVTEDILEELRQGCYELLDLLAPTFDRFDDNPSLDILLALTERPISLLRCAGYDWPEIENLLLERVTADEIGLDKTDKRLMQRIEFGEWAGQASPEMWQWYAARELFLTPQDLERRLDKLAQLRGLRWDLRQGTMVFVD
ncbi:MAG: hypothetical protein KC415_14795 [Anaerolineales bacterium]|nr:hypothetical protein [Anaerolineales bacterium]MCB8991425.1 hypothetical protein [Ardenticatenaceae bacterium]MCB9003955.1 hypothetical protein [Ardenticatenaceae bacterium]